MGENGRQRMVARCLFPAHSSAVRRQVVPILVMSCFWLSRSRLADAGPAGAEEPGTEKQAAGRAGAGNGKTGCQRETRDSRRTTRAFHGLAGRRPFMDEGPGEVASSGSL